MTNNVARPNFVEWTVYFAQLVASRPQEFAVYSPASLFEQSTINKLKLLQRLQLRNDHDQHDATNFLSDHQARPTMD